MVERSSRGLCCLNETFTQLEVNKYSRAQALTLVLPE